ncbi:MAG: DUF2089 domain-containing protein [Firmicutes bacterium]|nr:DUF2089 domain-containing protein [Bacillota bacterium]
MKTFKVPLQCPVCQQDMTIEKVSCHHCHTSIEGHYHVSKINYLPAETQYFIEIFLKNRGNIKAVEKELNVSYPTVKKYLDDTILRLGYQLDVEFELDTTKDEEDPITLLKQGKITAEEATKRLKKKGRL